MFTWTLTVETQAVHIPFWNGEKSLRQPTRVYEEEAGLGYEGTRLQGLGFSIQGPFVLVGEKGGKKANVKCAFSSAGLRVQVISGNVFLADGSRLPSYQWVDCVESYEKANGRLCEEVLKDVLRVWRDPDECHAYKLAIRRMITHRLVPIPGTRMKLDGRYIQIEDVVCEEETYLVTIDTPLPTLLNEKKEELGKDEWYQTLLELGEMPISNWFVTAERILCLSIH